MKNTFIISFITIFFFTSCNSNKKLKEKEQINGLSLEANHVPNNEFKLIYNSTDTISTTLIINNKTIERSKVKLVLDTLQIKNYKVNVNKQNRIIELISK